MNMSELIMKKRDGRVLTGEEIRWMISGYVFGSIPDYQMSAMLMAIYFSGMDTRETHDLTMAMLHSGSVLDLSTISGVKADKHSTGGVGDKTSLVLCPMVAAQGVKMAKMSGRGLGHTGGTIDKLESFPGFTTALSPDRFLENIDRVGFAIAGQTADIDPADKMLYALRDVTGTVESRPLIVSSIMSKKLAAGADVIVLDVKTGAGAFMKTEADAAALGRDMVQVGSLAGKRTAAVVTDMDQPLGNAIGNALEVKEAIALLKGEYAGDLKELCLTLGSVILTLSGAAPDETAARERLEASLTDGSALAKFAEFVRAQGGDGAAVYDTSLLPEAPVKYPVPATRDGYVSAIAADGIGRVSLHLGGGRATKESVIDLSVGVVLEKKVGDAVQAGETLAVLHARSEADAREGARLLTECYTITDTAPERKPLIRAVIK